VSRDVLQICSREEQSARNPGVLPENAAEYGAGGTSFCFVLFLLFSLMNAGQADAEKTAEMQRALFEHQRAIVSQYVMGSSRCVLHGLLHWRLNSTNLHHTEFAGLIYPSPLMTTARFRVETRLFSLKCNFALLQLLLCVISALF